MKFILSLALIAMAARLVYCADSSMSDHNVNQLITFYAGLFKSLGQTSPYQVYECIEQHADKAADLIHMQKLQAKFLSANLNNDQAQASQLQIIIQNIIPAIEPLNDCISTTSDYKRLLQKGLKVPLDSINDLLNSFITHNPSFFYDLFAPMVAKLDENKPYEAGQIDAEVLNIVISQIKDLVLQGRAPELYYEEFWRGYDLDIAYHNLNAFFSGFGAVFGLPYFNTQKCFDGDSALRMLRLWHTTHLLSHAQRNKKTADAEFFSQIHERDSQKLALVNQCLFTSDEVHFILKQGLFLDLVDSNRLLSLWNKHNTNAWDLRFKKMYSHLIRFDFYEAGQEYAKLFREVIVETTKELDRGKSNLYWDAIHDYQNVKNTHYDLQVFYSGFLIGLGINQTADTLHCFIDERAVTFFASLKMEHIFTQDEKRQDRESLKWSKAALRKYVTADKVRQCICESIQVQEFADSIITHFNHGVDVLVTFKNYSTVNAAAYRADLSQLYNLLMSRDFYNAGVKYGEVVGKAIRKTPVGKSISNLPDDTFSYDL